MRLVTFTPQGRTPGRGSHVGLLTADGVLDLAATGLPSSMIELLRLPDGLDKARLAADVTARTIPLPEVHLEAPIQRPGKVLAIGLNYRDHAEESGQAIPKYPVVFAKVSTCIVGPGAVIERPRVSAALDWEAELCFVIGKGGRHIAASDAMKHVAGYMCGNDVSVRDWQFHNPTWMMGKGFDTHGPDGSVARHQRRDRSDQPQHPVLCEQPAGAVVQHQTAHLRHSRAHRVSVYGVHARAG